MKAICISQPYATLIAKGRQIWLTRQHETPFRGEVAIVSAKNMEQEERNICLTQPVVSLTEHPSMLPKQRIVGLADLVACKPALMVFEMIIQPNYETLGLQIDLGRWEHGWWAYEFRNPRELKTPIESAGANHLWDLRPETEAEVIAQLAEVKAPTLCPTCGGTGFA